LRAKQALNRPFCENRVWTTTPPDGGRSVYTVVTTEFGQGSRSSQASHFVDVNFTAGIWRSDRCQNTYHLCAHRFSRRLPIRNPVFRAPLQKPCSEPIPEQLSSYNPFRKTLCRSFPEAHPWLFHFLNKPLRSSSRFLRHESFILFAAVSIPRLYRGILTAK